MPGFRENFNFLDDIFHIYPIIHSLKIIEDKLYIIAPSVNKENTKYSKISFGFDSSNNNLW